MVSSQPLRPWVEHAIPSSQLIWEQLFEIGALDSPASAISLQSKCKLAMLLTFKSVYRRSCAHDRWSCRCGINLTWLILHCPSTISIAGGDNLHDNILESAVLELWYVYLAREANRAWQNSRVCITAIRLLLDQKCTFRFKWTAELTRQWAHGALCTQTQCGQLCVKKYLHRYL